MTVLVKMHVPDSVPETTPMANSNSGVNLALVLDRSSSMGGRQRIGEAKRAAHGLIDRLGAADRVSVVVFSNRVDVLARGVPGDNQMLLHELIDSVEVGGQTDLHAGWLAGAQEVAAHFQTGSLNRVVLLSDGMANRGVTHLNQIVGHVTSLSRTGVSTTTIGVGDDFNEELLEAMAEAGDGNYHYAPDAECLSSLFAEELAEQRRVVGTQAVLRVSHRTRGVRVLPPLNALREKHPGAFKLGNLVAGKTLRVVFDAIVPSDVSAAEPLLTLELEWRDGDGAAHSVTADWRLSRVSETAFGVLQANPEVVLERALLQAAGCKRRAAEALEKRNMAEALQQFEMALIPLASVADDPIAMRMSESVLALRERALRGEVRRTTKQAKYESSRQRRKGD